MTKSKAMKEEAHEVPDDLIQVSLQNLSLIFLKNSCLIKHYYSIYIVK